MHSNGAKASEFPAHCCQDNEPVDRFRSEISHPWGLWSKEEEEVWVDEEPG